MTDGRLFVERQRLGLEQVLYTLGATGVLAHTIDHLASDPDWSPLFDLALGLAALTAGLALLYARIAPGLRALGALGMGLTWAVAGFVSHGLGVLVGEPDPTDYSGIAATVGGVLMVVAGFEAWAAHRAATTVSA